ncbi:N-6 DNA methylase [Streptomyces sp. NPDC059070]|uniref:N-6 DNA methylase n=1 Tax=Streptomyces sp. NPDC059070 TaxID=3346713 RepID=UPI0036738E0E
MSQLDLFAHTDIANEPSTPPTAEPLPPRLLADLPPAPAPVTISTHPRPMLATAKPALGHYRPAQRNPHETAFTIAEAVSYAWHHAQGGDRIDIPLGVVASLALWPLRGPDAYLAADWWLSLDDAQLLTAFRECWARWWIMRPDLIDRAIPLHKWLEDEEPPRRRAAAVRAVVKAALTRGLLHLTSSDDAYHRSTADLLGAVLVVMRPNAAQDALAEIHTPPELAELMAHMVLDDLKPGMTFDEPAGGTGGMYRAAAQVMREKSLNPHDFGWSLADIDPLAAAGAACNAILWDLGPNVLIACGDTLREGNLPRKAAREWREAHGRRDRLWREARMLAVLERTDLLVREIRAKS